MLRLWWLAAACAVLASCGGGAEPAPPEIQYGLEECGFCRMIVSEERFASAVVGEATRLVFDDVGCLLNHLRAHPQTDVEVWVHDYTGGGWLAAEEAHFVRDPRGATPMGSGLVAFSSRAEAEAVAGDRGASVMDWPALLARPAEE